MGAVEESANTSELTAQMAAMALRRESIRSMPDRIARYPRKSSRAAEYADNGKPGFAEYGSGYDESEHYGQHFHAGARDVGTLRHHLDTAQAG
jgi:hypothetical protein